MVKRQEFEKIIKTGKSLYAIVLDRVSKLDRHNTLIYSNAITDMCFNEIDFNKVYKTQAEAEWVAKMHAQRTEFFEPPTFENIREYKFIAKNGYKYGIEKIKTGYSIERENPYVIRISKFYTTEFKDWDYTKDNYIKACEYARNLFFGKEKEQ